MTRTEIENIVEEIINDHMGEGPQDLDQSFDALGLDSLDKIEILMEIEEEFDIEIDDEKAEEWKNLENIVDYLEGEA